MTSSIRKLAAAASLATSLVLGAGAASAAGDNTTSAAGGVSAAKALPNTCKGCFAVVDRAGKLVRGNNVLSSTRVDDGNYIVRFNGKITKCAFIASIGVTGFTGTETPGFISVAGAAGTTNAVFIDAQNMAGTDEDRAFHLDVKCP